MRAPPINNLDLSLSKVFPIARTVRFEARLDMFNALNHTQFTGVNSTVNFTSLTDGTLACALPSVAANRLEHHTNSGLPRAFPRTHGDVQL